MDYLSRVIRKIIITNLVVSLICGFGGKIISERVKPRLRKTETRGEIQALVETPS